MKSSIKYLFVLLFLSFTSVADAQLTLAGPSNVSYCDLTEIEYNAIALGYVDDAFDDVNWRYRFKLWSNGVVLATYTDDNIAQWTIDYNDFNFVAGPYQVSCEIQYRWALVWITQTTLWSNGINLSLYGTVGQYSASATSYRTVSGDFDRDGKENDIAAFYNYGGTTTALHVWQSDGSQLNYQGDNGWWYGTSFDATKITGRVVSGDFDRDGFKDDIAAAYDYGNNHTRFHVWTSTGTSFSYAGAWWISGSGASGYDANKVTGRLVSGDFDRDGYVDDLCLFYDYGNFTTTAHVFQSNGSAFVSSGAWYNSGTGNFLASAISFRVVSGDFDRDGYQDDITGFYGYSGFQTKAFVWSSNGSSFSSAATWYDSGAGNFDATKITGKVVAGDFDHDGYKDDITAFYQYSGFQTKGFVWKSTGAAFGYPLTWYDSGVGNFDGAAISGRTVSGDFDNDGFAGDIHAMYDYGNLSVRTFEWESLVSTFSSASKVWEVCNIASKSTFENPDQTTKEIQIQGTVVLSPNPTTGQFVVNVEHTTVSKVEVYSLNGTLMQIVDCSSDESIFVDISNAPKGIYILKAYGSNAIFIKKIVLY